MHGIITKQDLIDKGFSEKDLLTIDRLVARSTKKDETYASIIHELAKRFVRSLFCILIILLVLIFQLVKYGFENAVLYFIVFLFSVGVIYFLTPFKLALKSFVFLRKKE